MELQALTEASCPPGTVLRPYMISYGEQEIAQFLDRTGETVDAYRQGDRLYVPPGLLLGAYLRLLHGSFFYETGVHVSSRLTIQQAPLADQEIAVSGRCAANFERNGSKYVDVEITLRDSDGDTLATLEHVSIYQLKRPA